MSWSVWSVDTVTGVKQQRLPVLAFQWERALNSGGSGSAAIALRAADVARLDIDDLTTPLARTLVLEWGGVPVYAGAVDTRTYDHKSGLLTLRHSDVWTVLRRRLAIDHTVAESKLVNQVVSNLSSGTVAKRLVQLGLKGLSDMNMGLPITFSADVAGSISRTYFGYHFPWLGDLLDDLMNEGGGTDIDFRPRWVGNKLDYQMRTGSLTEGTFEWRVGGEKSGVIGLSVVEDSAKLASGVYALGEGSEVDKLARSRRVIDPVFPYTDRVALLSTEADVAALDRYAVGDLAAFKQPTEQWGFSVLASGSPKVSDLLLGGQARVWVQDDPWLTTGWHENRIVGFSGDLSETVKLQLQPGVV